MTSLRFITPNMHGVLDYISALLFIAFPLILGFQTPLALCLSVGAGIFLISYSLLTDYNLGLVKLIPFPMHVFGLDVEVGAAFLLSPFVFHFEGLVR